MLKKMCTHVSNIERVRSNLKSIALHWVRELYQAIIVSYTLAR